MSGQPNVYYRAMRTDQEGTFMRTGALGLCVREKATLDDFGDVLPDANGLIAPSAGGMSVARGSWKNLPFHRVPPRYERLYGHCDGHVKASIYEAKSPAWSQLTLRHVPLDAAPYHYQVEPCVTMTVAQLNAALWATAPDWRHFEPVR